METNQEPLMNNEEASNARSEASDHDLDNASGGATGEAGAGAKIGKLFGYGVGAVLDIEQVVETVQEGIKEGEQAQSHRDAARQDFKVLADAYEKMKNEIQGQLKEMDRDKA